MKQSFDKTSKVFDENCDAKRKQRLRQLELVSEFIYQKARNIPPSFRLKILKRLIQYYSHINDPEQIRNQIIDSIFKFDITLWTDKDLIFRVPFELVQNEPDPDEKNKMIKIILDDINKTIDEIKNSEYDKTLPIGHM